MTPAEMAEEVHRLSSLIDAGIRTMREQAEARADAEATYRKAKAEAWARCPNDAHDVKAGEREWTAARREAWVNAETADLRRARDYAEAIEKAAIESGRSRRAQLSALMTLLAAHRAEADLARVDVR